MFSWKIYEDRGVIVKRFVGEVSIDEFHECHLEIEKDQRSVECRYGVVDFRGATLNATIRDVRGAVEFYATCPSAKARWAVLTTDVFKTVLLNIASQWLHELTRDPDYTFKVWLCLLILWVKKELSALQLRLLQGT